MTSASQTNKTFEQLFAHGRDGKLDKLVLQFIEHTYSGEGDYVDCDHEATDALFRVTPKAVHGTLIIGARGSGSVENWITNLNAQKTSLVDSEFFKEEKIPNSGSVHSGFLNAYLLIRDEAYLLGDIKQASSCNDPPLKRVVVCGHSLGGALATLLALDLASRKFFDKSVSLQVVTLGSPCVGDKAFREFYSTFVPRTRRVTTVADPIPRLQSMIPGWGYTHVCNPLQLDSLPGPSALCCTMLQNLAFGLAESCTSDGGQNQFTSSRVLEGLIKYHSVDYYKAVSSREGRAGRLSIQTLKTVHALWTESGGAVNRASQALGLFSSTATPPLGSITNFVPAVHLAVNVAGHVNTWRLLRELKDKRPLVLGIRPIRYLKSWNLLEHDLQRLSILLTLIFLMGIFWIFPSSTIFLLVLLLDCALRPNDGHAPAALLFRAVSTSPNHSLLKHCLSDYQTVLDRIESLEEEARNEISKMESFVTSSAFDFALFKFAEVSELLAHQKKQMLAAIDLVLGLPFCNLRGNKSNADQEQKAIEYQKSLRQSVMASLQQSWVSQPCKLSPERAQPMAGCIHLALFMVRVQLCGLAVQVDDDELQARVEAKCFEIGQTVGAFCLICSRSTETQSVAAVVSSDFSKTFGCSAPLVAWLEETEAAPATNVADPDNNFPQAPSGPEMASQWQAAAEFDSAWDAMWAKALVGLAFDGQHEELLFMLRVRLPLMERVLSSQSSMKAEWQQVLFPDASDTPLRPKSSQGGDAGDPKAETQDLIQAMRESTRSSITIHYAKPIMDMVFSHPNDAVSTSCLPSTQMLELLKQWIATYAPPATSSYEIRMHGEWSDWLRAVRMPLRVELLMTAAKALPHCDDVGLEREEAESNWAPTVADTKAGLARLKAKMQSGKQCVLKELLPMISDPKDKAWLTARVDSVLKKIESTVQEKGTNLAVAGLISAGKTTLINGLMLSGFHQYEDAANEAVQRSTADEKLLNRIEKLLQQKRVDSAMDKVKELSSPSLRSFFQPESSQSLSQAVTFARRGLWTKPDLFETLDRENTVKTSMVCARDPSGAKARSGEGKGLSVVNCTCNPEVGDITDTRSQQVDSLYDLKPLFLHSSRHPMCEEAVDLGSPAAESTSASAQITAKEGDVSMMRANFPFPPRIRRPVTIIDTPGLDGCGCASHLRAVARSKPYFLVYVVDFNDPEPLREAGVKLLDTLQSASPTVVPLVIVFTKWETWLQTKREEKTSNKQIVHEIKGFVQQVRSRLSQANWKADPFFAAINAKDLDSPSSRRDCMLFWLSFAKLAMMYNDANAVSAGFNLLGGLMHRSVNMALKQKHGITGKHVQETFEKRLLEWSNPYSTSTEKLTERVDKGVEIRWLCGPAELKRFLQQACGISEDLWLPHARDSYHPSMC